MDRRKFLQGVTSATAALHLLPTISASEEGETLLACVGKREMGWVASDELDLGGQTLVCTFQFEGETWNAYEDLRTRDGSVTFVSSRATGSDTALVLAKSAEATFAEADPPYLGLKLSDIGMAGPDLLADKLIQDGDPDPKRIKAAVPPMDSAPPEHPYDRPAWNTILGTKECSDTMPVYPSGNTRTYHPIQYFPELDRAAAARRYEGLVGGWMPAVRKVFPVANGGHYEAIVLGDVATLDRFIVQTWHRTVQIKDGKIIKVQYGYSYPAYPPAREDPTAEEFFRGLLLFALYWQMQLKGMAQAALPDSSWVDMVRHAFVKELIVRPGGVYPKYGAVDRDYYGPEYDGFQDIFTMSLYANLEWGRFEMAREVLDNYYSSFVDGKGMVNMRGPETAQFGLTLSLLARYFVYTGDNALLRKHKAKIEATAAILTTLHDESCRLPKDDVGYGLIHGWNESDSCLMPKPMTWWQPYFANSAFAARGLKDIASVWRAQGQSALAKDWLRHSEELKKTLISSVRNSVKHEMKPAYVGPLPGTTLTFRESIENEKPSPQGWPHRAYAELLQADVLPPDLANLVIDCMRAYGGTTLGVVANVEPARPDGRDILGFISYGYAQMLLRLDRIEEYLLFLYSHRFHVHSRGSWTAGEVSGITGDGALFCIPAQQTIPLLVRWMMVLEDSDEDRLYFGKGLPRDWITSGQEIRVEQAPTRFGRVDFKMISGNGSIVNATIALEPHSSLKELQVKFRLPTQHTLKNVKVNGRPAQFRGDFVEIAVGSESRFEVVAEYV